MHYSKIVLAIFAISLLSAYAEQQQSNTAYVSPLEFKHYNCKQLSKEMIRTSQMLDKSNDDAALSDVAGTAIALFAISKGQGVSFGEDEETTRLKSKYEALHQVAIEKDCD